MGAIGERLGDGAIVRVADTILRAAYADHGARGGASDLAGWTGCRGSEGARGFGAACLRAAEGCRGT